MTLLIDISTETEKRLRKRAERSGRDLDDVVRTILDESVMTLAEAAAPLHSAFDESGMTQDELDVFSDEVIREVRAERRMQLR